MDIFLAIVIIIALATSINLFYKRIYIRSRSRSTRIVLLNRRNMLLRIIDIVTVLVVVLSNIYIMLVRSGIDNRTLSVSDISFPLGFVALLVIRGCLEIQKDVITDDELFIKEGNYYLKDLESYSWKVSHDLKFGEKDIKYDELLLIMKAKNFFERRFKGKENFEIKVRVKKDDVQLVDSMLKKS